MINVPDRSRVKKNKINLFTLKHGRRSRMSCESSDRAVTVFWPLNYYLDICCSPPPRYNVTRRRDPVDISFFPFPFNNIRHRLFFTDRTAYGDKTWFLLLFAPSKIQSRQRNEISPPPPAPVRYYYYRGYTKTVKFLHVYHIRYYVLCNVTRIVYARVQSIVFGDVAIVSRWLIDEYEMCNTTHWERSKN